MGSVKGPSSPEDYRSAHFLVHTDLAAKDARKLLDRLEVMLGLISKYWGQPPTGTIECYVVDDLHNWPAGSLPPAGLTKVRERAGITMVETMNQGPRTLAAKAVVVAVTENGTPQHEAVHAYCGQTFGKTGPLWYAEGMAEVGQYWRQNDTSVHCHPHIIKYLRSTPAKPLAAVLAEDGAARPGQPQAVTGDSWQNYAWRWALCHMLVNNANYAGRFRPFGQAMLAGQAARFEEVFAPMMREIEFEYLFFLAHVEDGYRVDLCRWDWNRKFKSPRPGAPITAHVAANHGWQPSGAELSTEHSYHYQATGSWQTAKDSKETSADGGADNLSRLEGVMMNDYTLGEPFLLGANGTFTPPSEGQLYLRCHDAWTSLADNKGTLTVKISSTAAAPEENPSTAQEDAR